MSLRNYCKFIGNIGRDIDYRFTSNDKLFGKFPFAVNQRVPAGDGTYKTEPVWLDCVVWERIAERAQQVLKKGSFIEIEAEYVKRSYQTPEGETRWVHEFKVRDFELLGRGNRSDVEDGGYEESGQPTIDDDDVPF